mgnify:CR=1 FL=1
METNKRVTNQPTIFDTNDKIEFMKIFDSLDDSDKLKENSNEKSKSVDEISRKWQMNDKVVDLFCGSIDSDVKLKEKYAKILVIMLAIQLFALNGIFIARGLNFINYSDVAFNIFITGSLGEIFGLVMVIVKYLFKDNLSESLQIILKSTNFSKKISNKNNDITKQG